MAYNQFLESLSPLSISSSSDQDLGSISSGNLSIGPDGLLVDGKQASIITSFNDLEDTGHLLGKGASASVWKVRHKPTSQVYALKSVRIEDRGVLLQKLVELKALQSSTHPCIVSFYGAFYISATLYLVLEFMDGGTLADLLKKCGKIEEKILVSLSHKIVSGLEYLHKEMHVIHRDIKPQNILINQKGEVKITDFGVCSELAHTCDVANTFTGTAKYMSPERLKAGSYTRKSDIWSLGIVLYQCAVGHYPYGDALSETTNFWSLLMVIANGDPPRLHPEQFTADFCDLITLCLQKNEADRPDCATLLNHRWFSRTKDDLTSWLTNYTK
jgi:mitogen-activated protein kinase kinase 1